MPFHMVGSILLKVLALKTNSIEASDWLLENLRQSESVTLQAKRITPCERAWNTVPENSVRNCVHFCLQPLVSLERCAQYNIIFIVA